MVKTCPHCGTVLNDKMFTSRKRQHIVDFIRSHPGCSMPEIMSAVYADDPNGGPESDRIISVFIFKMKKTLAEHGLRIKTRTGPGAGYFLVPLNEDTHVPL